MFWARSREKPHQEAASSTADTLDVLRDQVKNGIETYRFMMGLLIQVWGFLAAAGALLFAYGLNLGVVAPILLASLAPLFMFVAYVAVLQDALPVLASTLLAERKLGRASSPLASTCAMVRYGSLVQKFDQLLVARGDAGAAIRGIRITSRAMRSRTLLVFGVATLACWGIAAHLTWQLEWPLFGASDGGRET